MSIEALLCRMGLADVACRLLFDTRISLLASRFLLRASCFLLLASCFLLLASCFLLLARLLNICRVVGLVKMLEVGLAGLVGGSPPS